MANNTAINTVYNHFLTTYAPQGTNTKYDTHKKSELRGVYNSILKKTKDAPLFLLNNSAETKEFAVTLKENARSFRNTIASLSLEDSNELLNQKSVASSDDSIVSAKYIGGSEESAPDLEISVKQLASNQVNEGTYLDPGKTALKPGTYSFDIHSRDMDFEFQFNIGENDTNQLLEEKLARLITKSNIGVKASIETNSEGKIALKLASDDTGLHGDSDTLFDVTDNNTSKTSGTVEYFGIGNVTQAPSNSLFTLNGTERSTFSNNFSIDKTYELSLNSVSPDGSTTHIGLKNDVESLTENVGGLINGYNNFISGINAFASSQPYSRRLTNEMNSIIDNYRDQLGSIGINADDTGMIFLDKNLLENTAVSNGAKADLNILKEFTSTVLDKINQVTLDPLEYADKKIVEYKNPGHNFSSPYVTSNYSGMMFNGYC